MKKTPTTNPYLCYYCSLLYSLFISEEFVVYCPYLNKEYYKILWPYWKSICIGWQSLPVSVLMPQQLSALELPAKEWSLGCVNLRGSQETFSRNLWPTLLLGPVCESTKEEMMPLQPTCTSYSVYFVKFVHILVAIFVNFGDIRIQIWYEIRQTWQSRSSLKI